MFHPVIIVLIVASAFFLLTLLFLVLGTVTYYKREKIKKMAGRLKPTKAVAENEVGRKETTEKDRSAKSDNKWSVGGVLSWFWRSLGKVALFLFIFAALLSIISFGYGLFAGFTSPKPQISKLDPLPSPEKSQIKIIKQDVAVLLPQVTTGHHWHIYLGDASDVCEFRGERTLSNGTVEQLGPWEFGGATNLHKEFPECDKYWITLKNNQESRLTWWED